LSKEEEFLPDTHPITIVVNTLQDEFDGGGNQEMMVDVFWGIKELDTTGYNHWNPEFIGKAVMDTQFDLSPIES
jgi:hypothetical protein